VSMGFMHEVSLRGLMLLGMRLWLAVPVGEHRVRARLLPG
jgi:hypothetical protein